MNIDVPDVEMDEVYEEGEREEFPPGEFEAEEDGPAPVNSSDDEGGEPAEKKIKSKSAAKKVVKNPQVKLDDMRLCGQRGIPLLPKTFRDVEFKGKGHEVEDLDLYLSKMEHWAHRMFPKMNFDEVIDRCDRLYKTKKLVKTTLIRMRNSDNLLDDDVDDRDDVAREGGGDVGEDEFDDDAPPADVDILSSTRPLNNDGAPPTTATATTTTTTAPPPPPPAPMSEEIRDKIERNKRLALEKRMARLQAMREQEVADAQAPPAVGETQTPSSAAPTTEMPISSSSSSSSPAAASVTTTPASSSGPLHSMPTVVSKTVPPTSIPIRKEGTNTSAEMASGTIPASTTEISSNAQPNSKTVETTESRSEEEPGQSEVSSTPSTAAPTAAASAPTTLSAPTAPGSASTAPGAAFDESTMGSKEAMSPRNEPEPELDEDELLKLINE